MSKITKLGLAQDAL